VGEDQCLLRHRAGLRGRAGGCRGACGLCRARAERLEATVEAMQAAGYSAEALPLDQGDLGALKAALSDAAYDVVVNSAGLARHGPALDTTPADYDAVMGVNLRSAYFLSAWAARAMVAAQKPGSIIHISSQMGHVGGIDRAVYCASKHGLEGMVKANGANRTCASTPSARPSSAHR